MGFTHQRLHDDTARAQLRERVNRVPVPVGLARGLFREAGHGLRVGPDDGGVGPLQSAPGRNVS